jgi:hypothetical protein
MYPGSVYFELAVILLLGWVVIWFTFPFEEKYDERLRDYSQEPLFRTLMGILLIFAASVSVPVALLLFLIMFFLITDVHLVSTAKF